MTQLQLLNDLAVVMAQVVFWVSVGFVIGVSTFWPWWKTNLGLTIVLKTACIAAILLPFNLHVLLGINEDTIAWRWFGVIMLGGIAAVIVWRFIVMWVIQRYDPPPTKSGREALGNARQRWKFRTAK